MDDRNELKTTIVYVSRLEHFGAMLRGHWRSLIVAAFSALGISWGVLEFTAYTLGTDLSGPNTFSAIAMCSILAAIAYVAWKYWWLVPAGFEHEPPECAIVVHRKPAYWEFKLALLLLNDRTARIDKEMSDVLEGRRLVPITAKPKISDYISWVELRPTNVIRMVDVMKRLLVHTLPAALKSTEQQMADPVAVRKAVDHIAELYKTSYQFEVEGRSIQPPGRLEKLHELQTGWTKSIQDSVAQMRRFLETITSRTTAPDGPMKWQIIFESPANVEQFSEELEALRQNIARWVLEEEFGR